MHFPAVKKLSVLVWTGDLNELNFKCGQDLYVVYLFVCVTFKCVKTGFRRESVFYCLLTCFKAEH